MRSEIEAEIRKIVTKLYGIETIPAFSVEAPESDAYGDYATNIAMALSKVVKRPPMEIAKEIASGLKSEEFSKVDVALPGFINIFISAERFHEELTKIIKNGERYGRALSKNEK